MKAEELMLGDWVRFENSDLCHQVYAVQGKSVKIDKQYWNKADKLQPIPLTAEILEKNGIDPKHTPTYFDEDENLVIEIFVAPNGIWWSINLAEYMIFKFNYVHQLQNALNLCGIKKEIIL